MEDQGHERRSTTLTNTDLLKVREAIKEEIIRAKGNGDLLSDDERDFIRAWLKNHEARRKFFLGVSQMVVGGVGVSIVLGTLIFIGAAIMDAIRDSK